MGLQVSATASLLCTMGMAPSTLMVLPVNRVLCGGPPAANIMDNKPFVNILPFGMCMSPANPAVAAATAAAGPKSQGPRVNSSDTAIAG